MFAALVTRTCPGLILTFALALTAPAQVTTRVSVGSGGTQADHDSYSPALSANGRHVAFYSEATNLVPGDTNDSDDIFLHDRRRNLTSRVSVDTAGVEGNGDSYSPVLSANGRYVAFYSEASNLVPGDTNDTDDIFVHDVRTGTTQRVSVDSRGVQGNGRNLYPSISIDGRYIVFHSWATNLIASDTNGDSDVFVHDRASGITTRVSVDESGAEANDQSSYGTISADGRRVAFESWASNLAPGDTNGSPDIFLRDLALGTTTCVSVNPGGAPGDAGCSYASISGDGRSVAFASWSTNLVLGDTNDLTDTFVRSIDAGRTALISVSTGGTQGNGISQVHTLSALSHDGRFVAFKSAASNLVEDDTNGLQDIFLRDRELLTTTRMNLGPRDVEALGSSSQPAISADGQHVSFYSFASNLVTGDTNGVPDAFVRSRF